MRLAHLFSASLDAGLYYALSGLMHTTRLTRGFDFECHRVNWQGVADIVIADTHIR